MRCTVIIQWLLNINTNLCIFYINEIERTMSLKDHVDIKPCKLHHIICKIYNSWIISPISWVAILANILHKLFSLEVESILKQILLSWHYSTVIILWTVECKLWNINLFMVFLHRLEVMTNTFSIYNIFRIPQ